MREDSISDAWSESRIEKPKKYNMPIWLTDEDFDYIVLALWKGRKNAGESKCAELYTRFKAIQDAAKNK